jgi:hypothetical protein
MIHFEVRSQYLQNVKSWAGHRGKKEMIEHLEGKVLNRAAAQLAYCYGCMAGYSDGNKDCGMEHCPLYPYQPYGTKKPKSTKVGKELSQEQKDKMQAGRKAKREPGSFKIGKLPS